MTSQWQTLLQNRLALYAMAAISGGFFPLGLAPISYWPLTLVSVMGIAWLWRRKKGKSFWLGWWYGLGVFSVGVSWVSASMAVSGTPPLLTLLLTGAFCMALALLFGAQLTLLSRFKTRNTASEILVFASAWVLFEWLRSWIFTGFPWLFAGYALTDTWAAAFAPIVGVYGLSGIMAAFASAWALALSTRKLTQMITTTFASILIVLTALLFQQFAWVSDTGETLDTVIIQGNIDQQTKWDFDRAQGQFDLYLDASKPHTDSDLIVWPEAAITTVQSRASSYLKTLDTLGKTTNTTFVTGIITDPIQDGRRHYYNSALALGSGSGSYDKTRMVPFGEYVPFADQIRGLLSFFDLPLSTLEPGIGDSPGLMANNLILGLLICYEIAYPAMSIARAASSDIIVTLSNDAWFGVTWGPYQHLEMARMRAMEVGRPIVRATQDGVSAFIDHRGDIVAMIAKHQKASIRYAVHRVTGTTPYSRWGFYWMLAMSALVLAVQYLRERMRAST